MLDCHQVEELISVVAAMDRSSLLEQFHCYKSRFPLDFTDDFLHNTPLDRLRHIFVAVCLQSQHLPELATSNAA